MARRFSALLIASGLVAFIGVGRAWANDPAATMQGAERVLAELVAIPMQRIPTRLLADAQGVAIIPRVIKAGFIAGIRRGHGVVLVRDADGEWGLPQFLTLTGGSVGWQAGIQGTDVVLVFRTRASVDNLMRGKFTVGVDAAAAAGPVGRNAAAATDAQLRAEILSYSRSRGLFVGVSFDGSSLQIDQNAIIAFYGSPSTEAPQRIPESAMALRQYLSTLLPAPAAAATAPAAADASAAPTPSGAIDAATRFEALDAALYQNHAELQTLLTPEWQRFLALPPPTDPPGAAPTPPLETAYQRFLQVSASPEFSQLTQRPEFQATTELLRQYVEALTTGAGSLRLPPPPAPK